MRARIFLRDLYSKNVWFVVFNSVKHVLVLLLHPPEMTLEIIGRGGVDYTCMCFVNRLACVDKLGRLLKRAHI